MNKYYEPKYLRGVIQKALPLKLFLRTRFFAEGITFPTESVSFEFASDKRRLLPYANSHMPSPSVDRSGYQLKTFTPPLLSGSRTITNDTLAEKVLGESEWNSGLSADERAAKIAATDLMELQDSLYRKEEYMCARVKQDGKLDTGSGIVDYGFGNIETLSGNAQWKAGTDILGALQKKARELRKSGTNPDMLILGTKAAEALMGNTAFKELLKEQAGYIVDPHNDLEDGVNYLCKVRVPGLYLDVYEYNEYYNDPVTGELVAVMDEATAILQSSRESNYMLYGAVNYVRDRQYVSEMGEYVPYIAVSEDPPAQKLIVSSRSLPMPRDIESWAVMKNVA